MAEARITTDIHNPYYIHYSNNPNTSLVSQPLTGDNYVSWRRAMLKALSAKDKIGFVDGSFNKPTDSDLLYAWTRNNGIIVSWILNSVSKDIAASLVFSDLALQVWQELHDRFYQTNGPRFYELRKALLGLQQGDDSISVYYTRMKTIYDQLQDFHGDCSCTCSCGGLKHMKDLYHNDHIVSFLMGLHESFNQVRSQILLMDPLPSITQVYSLLIQEELQRCIGETATSSPLTLAASRNLASRNQTSVSRNHNTVSRSYIRDRPMCTYCKISRHIIHKCYKSHGYPPGHALHAKASQTSSRFSTHQVSTDQSDVQLVVATPSTPSITNE